MIYKIFVGKGNDSIGLHTNKNDFNTYKNDTIKVNKIAVFFVL